MASIKMAHDYSGLLGLKTIETAVKYLDWGFVPLALIPGEKRPFNKGWPRINRGSSLRMIEGALSSFEWKMELNLGVLCGSPSNVIVLDIDNRKNGVEKWKKAIEEHGDVETFTVQTGGGGMHLYFRYDTSAAIFSTSVDAITEGWDVRSTGGQVVGPFSIHPVTGKTYVPIKCFDEERGPTIASVPDWLINMTLGSRLLDAEVIKRDYYKTDEDTEFKRREYGKLLMDKILANGSAPATAK